MLGPRRLLKQDDRIVVSIPEEIETTADELAPALSAA
jgi:hypothetical protein